jgi:hypothetical protein
MMNNSKQPDLMSGCFISSKSEAPLNLFVHNSLGLLHLKTQKAIQNYLA